MRVIRTLVSVSYVCPLLITLIGLPYSRAYAKDQSPADDGAKASVDGEEREERYSKMEDLGIDLVITKVRTTRGDWSEGDVQIVTYVKNMCNSHVTQLIKVNYPNYATAVWLRTGLGPKQEKSTGAIYVNESSDRGLGSFSVEVDSDDDIRENNETNNVVTIPAFPPGTTRRTYACAIAGPHCRRGLEIKKYQMREGKIR